jgi:hypothetical protein
MFSSFYILPFIATSPLIFVSPAAPTTDLQFGEPSTLTELKMLNTYGFFLLYKMICVCGSSKTLSSFYGGL